MFVTGVSKICANLRNALSQEHVSDMCQVGALLTLKMSSESYMSISLELLMGVLKNTEILHFTSVFQSSNKNVDMNGFRSLNTNQSLNYISIS